MNEEFKVKPGRRFNPFDDEPGHLPEVRHVGPDPDAVAGTPPTDADGVLDGELVAVAPGEEVAPKQEPVTIDPSKITALAEDGHRGKAFDPTEVDIKFEDDKAFDPVDDEVDTDLCKGCGEEFHNTELDEQGNCRECAKTRANEEDNGYQPDPDPDEQPDDGRPMCGNCRVNKATHMLLGRYHRCDECDPQVQNEPGPESGEAGSGEDDSVIHDPNEQPEPNEGEPSGEPPPFDIDPEDSPEGDPIPDPDGKHEHPDGAPNPDRTDGTGTPGTEGKTEGDGTGDMGEDGEPADGGPPSEVGSDGGDSGDEGGGDPGDGPEPAPESEQPEEAEGDSEAVPPEPEPDDEPAPEPDGPQEIEEPPAAAEETLIEDDPEPGVELEFDEPKPEPAKPKRSRKKPAPKPEPKPEPEPDTPPKPKPQKKGPRVPEKGKVPKVPKEKDPEGRKHSEQRNRQVYVAARMTGEEKDEIITLAKQEGLSIGEFIRTKCLGRPTYRDKKAPTPKS